MATLLKHKIIQAMGPDPSTLLDRHEDYLFRHAMFRLRDPMAAEGVLQETLLAAMKGFSYVRGASSERTCEALNVSRENLWVMLHRARISLRRFLQVNWFDAPAKPTQTPGTNPSQLGGHIPTPTSVSFASDRRLTA